MDILYDKRLERGDAEYSLKNVDKFKQTDDLSQALEPFFLDKSKGIHVATICTDERTMPTKDLQCLFYAFMTSDENLCEINPSKVVPSGWKHGSYFYIDYAEGIINSLEIIIKCAKGLGIDTSKAENGLNTYRNSEDNPYAGNIWTQANAWQFSQIVETSQGCGNIRILLILSEKYFNIFQMNDHYFPSQFEHIVRGISARRVIETLGKELEETEAELEETKAKYVEAKAELEETKAELTITKNERDNYKQRIRILEGVKRSDVIEIISMFLTKENEHDNYLTSDSWRSLINQWLQEYIKGENLKRDFPESNYDKPHELEDTIQGREQAIEPDRTIPEQHKDSTKEHDDFSNDRSDDNRDER